MVSNRSVAISVVLSSVLVAHVHGAESTTKTGELREVVVTGSRLASGFDTPTPVTTINASELAMMAPNSLAGALQQIPGLGNSVQGSTAGVKNTRFQATGQDILNLHNLGSARQSNRTLVLVDGQRMGPTNSRDSVDIGIIPQSLVKSVDVVTGGASATYGADAVAGAVNFILDSKFVGVKTDFNGGISSRSDTGSGNASVTFGKAYGDRFHLVGSLRYYTSAGWTYGEKMDRDWYDHAVAAYPNPVAGALPTTVLVPDARAQFLSYGGTITAVQGCPAGTAGNTCRALVNQKFLPGGALSPFVLGTQAGGGFASGGDGANLTEVPVPYVKRQSLFLRGTFDVNPDLTFWAEASANTNATHLDAAVTLTTNYSIQANNAYLPAAVSAVLPPTGTFTLQRASQDMGYTTVRGGTAVQRYVTGLKGRINERWSWDTTLAYQDTHQEIDNRTANTRRLYAAADAVVNPANGQIVCRSTLFGLDPGCAPANLFGDGSVSQAASNYIMGVDTVDYFFKQTTVDANLRGDFGDRVSLGAGPISFAVGANYRKNTIDLQVSSNQGTTVDGTGVRGFPSSQQGSLIGLYPFNGASNATEVYTEFGIPLLKDRRLVKSLTGTAAGRLTRYSYSGNEFTWKLGVNWTLNNSVRFRYTWSADNRAPDALELFDPGTTSGPVSLLPYSAASGAFRSAPGTATQLGNPHLVPEKAHTSTAGIVLTPSFAPGLQASIDWFKIDVAHAIGYPTNQNVIDNCYFGRVTYCSYIRVNGKPITTTTGITDTDFIALTVPTGNQGTLSVSGLDFQLAERFSLPAGNVTMRMDGGYLLTYDNPQLSCPAGHAGSNASPLGSVSVDCGNDPRLLVRLSADYEVGRFGLVFQERFIQHAKIDPNYVSGVDISYNEIPSIWYTDLNVIYRAGSWFGGQTEIFANVTNLFDRSPPVSENRERSSSVVPSEVYVYDIQGRRFTVGVRARW